MTKHILSRFLEKQQTEIQIEQLRCIFVYYVYGHSGSHKTVTVYDSLGARVDCVFQTAVCLPDRTGSVPNNRSMMLCVGAPLATSSPDTLFHDKIFYPSHYLALRHNERSQFSSRQDQTCSFLKTDPHLKLSVVQNNRSSWCFAISKCRQSRFFVVHWIFFLAVRC